MHQLINNAGINGSALAKAGASLREQFHAVFNTNVFGAAVVTDAFLPLLRQSTAEEGKRIVFVSSSMGALTLVADPGVYTGPTLLVYPSVRHHWSCGRLEILLTMWTEQNGR